MRESVHGANATCALGKSSCLFSVPLLRTAGVPFIHEAFARTTVRPGAAARILHLATRHGIQDRERIIAATDLVALIGEHIQLRLKGREHEGLCPFHDDSRPSLKIVTHKDRPFYKCFSCNAHGDAITFMMDYHKMTFPEALRGLAERAGIELSTGPGHGDEETGSRRADLLRATEAAARWYRRRLLDENIGAKARSVLSDRGIDEKTAERFMIGVAPDDWDGLCTRVAELEKHAQTGDRKPIPFDAFVETALIRPRRESSGHYDVFRNRLIFPICDEMNRPIAFGARSLDPNDEPKYLNSPENPLFDKSSTLYALPVARKPIIDANHAIIVEGYTDAIACHQADIPNVVATLGTALTRQHARRLERLCSHVTLVFDGDDAGQRAADRAVEVFFHSKIDLRICTLPGGNDPDDLLRKPNGLSEFKSAIDCAQDVLAHLTMGFREQYKQASGVSEREQVINAILDRLSSLGFDSADGIRKHVVLDAIASNTGIPESQLDQALTARGRKPAPANTVEVKDPVSPAQNQFEEGTDGTDIVSPALCEAERRLLALLVKDPDLGRLPVPTDEGTSLTVSELHPPSSFKLAIHRTLAEIIIPAIEEGESPQVDQLLLAVEEATTANLVTDLFRFGRDLLEQTEDTPETLLATAVRDLEMTARRERHSSGRETSSNTDPGADLDKALERLRHRGSDMTTIPRVQRPRRPVTAGANPARQRPHRS